LGLVELAHFYESAILFGVAAFFCAPHPIIGGALSAACFLGVILVDNLCARLRTFGMVRFMWSLPLAFALANVTWLYLA
jgi:ech hydrogenase subunit B